MRRSLINSASADDRGQNSNAADWIGVAMATRAVKRSPQITKAITVVSSFLTLPFNVFRKVGIVRTFTAIALM